MLRKFGILLNRENSRSDRIAKTASPGTRGTKTGTKSFVYTPLQDVDEIRLLSIAPRNETASNNGPNVVIQHARLSASPLYTAVSWMWGRSGDMVDIQIDGQTLTIQRNLCRIIEHLRDDHQTRRVWIDAICIDQKSLEERNHQVQLMGKIYSNANYVVACLTAERQIDSRRLQHEAKKLHKLLREGKSTNTSRYRHFFGNQYFTRRWIIQEISQAQAVTFCCEGYHVPMSLLSDGFKDLRLQTKREAPEEYTSFSGPERMAESRATQLCLIEPRTQKTSMPMEELLYLHETAECSDFRDKIYALLSLTSQAQLHLLVQYNIDRVQLMLSVLHICCTYEGLSMFRTLSFTCFLRQHLEVGIDDLRNGILDSTTPMISTTFTIRGTVHGKIETLQTGARVEETALRFRNILPTLFVHPVLSLNPIGTFESAVSATSIYLEIDRQASPATLLRPTAEIPGIDQCLFAFIGNELSDLSPATSTEDLGPPPAYASTRGSPFAGFASTRVDIGDEIWQFDRTPIAVVARKTFQGYSLVGRAFLIRDMSAGNQGSRPDRSSKRFEDELVWVKDGTRNKQLTPTIRVDIKGLYEMMTWVNFD